MTLLAMLEALDLEELHSGQPNTPSRALADESAERQQINQGPCHQRHPSDWPKVGKSTTYRLSPEFGWKGGAKQHHAALLAKRMEAANIRGIVTRDPNTVDFINEATDTERER